MSFWERCAVPVLEGLARCDDRNVRAGFLSLGHGRAGQKLGLALTDAEIHEALLALGDVGYVEWNEIHYETGPGASFSGLRVTGRGQQARGQWPYFDLMTSPETLARTFEALADLVPEDERSALLKARDKVLSLGREAVKAGAIGAASQLARNAAGLP